MEKKIIRFTASWCQPCKMLGKILEDADLGIPVEVVDIDENQELAMQYKIRGVPTMVLVGGESEKRLVGVHNEEQIKSWIAE